MNRKRTLYFVLFVTVAAFAVWLDPTRIAWGWLRGEAFYENRPTAFWRHQLMRWQMDEKNWGCLEIWTRDKDWMDEVNEWWTGEMAFESMARPEILRGDAAAQAVLEALRDDPSEHIRQHAELGLTAIRNRQGLP